MKKIFFTIGKGLFLLTALILTFLGFDNYYAMNRFEDLVGVHHAPGWFGGLFFDPHTEVRNDGSGPVYFSTEDGHHYVVNPGESVTLLTPATPGKPYWLYRDICGVSYRATALIFPAEANDTISANLE